MSELTLVSENKCCDGKQLRYRHFSSSTQCEMTFSVFLPSGASEQNQVPVLYWLSGLTCTDENFIQKAGAQKLASQLGIAIVAPDTSPRGDEVPDVKESWDIGKGAGFYVNATQQPWSKHYNMYDYVVDELPRLIKENFPVNHKQAISGHSMGGHGALICAIKNPNNYTSVSAFAPIANPSQCPWGHKAFGLYLGDKKADWTEYDSCELIKQKGMALPMLVDQGDADEFLAEQLNFNNLQQACETAGVSAEIRMQPGYDHSYFFIASYIDEHLAFHHQYLKS
ncbi:S-formylglutathione hydrolase [Flocculibacter collagenilyticus]|uniref:S-formylglutathione hydrolase n=1 Tax=Flocculibacter collagenilyticus TaxID=2744479 RepID=UPI0018F7730B|nr:S-formylglutathione hydrolase [Flocculibacter collagenilyticus]